MKILVASDKFKDALDAPAVCEAIARGARPLATEVVTLPLADGGEGTAALLARATGGTLREATVADPLGRPVRAAYGLSGDGRTAYVEMAAASGLHRLAPAERRTVNTSTYGTGELIAAALAAGAQEVILTLGGSATTDAGLGMALALGYRAYDEAGQPIAPRSERGAAHQLGRVARLTDEAVLPALRRVRFRVACDVTNPLSGPRGSAHVYAPQKGATPEEVAALDAGLRHFGAHLAQLAGRPVADQPGAGAAGGMGAGGMAFLNAELTGGAALVLDALDFDARLGGVDLVVTGEGSLDEQTTAGKLVAEVAHRAGAHDVPVAALCGRLAITPSEAQRLGLAYAVSVLTRPVSLAEALPETADALERAAYFLTSLFAAARR